MTESDRNPQAPCLEQPEDEARWLRGIRQSALVFAGHPLIAKWAKTFREPAILILANNAVDLAPWKKRFKPRVIQQMRWDEAVIHASRQTEYYDLIVFIRHGVSPRELRGVLPLLRRGGALLMVTRNLRDQWPQWQATLEEMHMTDTFAAGFHGRGAVAWWPFQSGLMFWLGILADWIAPFFPKRNTMGFLWGRRWVIRSFKRDDVTILP